MTLTNLSQITTSGISTLADINLNNLTGVAATFTGNVTVGGTLTYDDVTNIDSVGLVTARSGVEITSGDLTIPDSIVHRGDTNTKIRFPADDTVTVETAGAERVRVSAGGSVGIGLTNPSEKLHTIGDVMIQGTGGTGEQTLFIGKSATVIPSTRGVAVAADQDSSAFHDMVLKTSTNSSGLVERMRIESDGQVVINRSSGAVLADSSSKLEVYNATENHIFVANSTAAASQDAGIMFAPANNVYGGKIIVTSDEDFSTSANRTAHMAFYTRQDGTASERLRITSGGTVQIGNPTERTKLGGNYSSKLQVEGTDFDTARISIISNSTNNSLAPQLVLGKTSTADINSIGAVEDTEAFGAINFMGSDGTFFREGAFIEGRVDGTVSSGVVPGSLRFHTTNSSGSRIERLRITSAGLVGIGTDNPEEELSIQLDSSSDGPTLRLRNANGGDGTFLGRIQTGDAAGTFFAGINFLKHDSNDGEIRLRTKVAGSNTDVVTIVDGNVGIGLNNPSVPLHIFGSYPTLKIQNSATAQYASASIDLQGPAGDERYTKILHGNSNTGGTETYFQIEQYDAAGSYVKTLSQYSYEYDYWSFNTGGSERLRIASSGNVGINSTSPDENLCIYDSGFSGIKIHSGRTADNQNIGGLLFYNHVGVSTAYIYGKTGGRLVFGTAGTERMRIMSDGTVKIGTGTGNPILMLNASTSGTSVIQMGDTADNNIGQIHYVNSDDSMKFFANNAERLRITSGGRLLYGNHLNDRGAELQYEGSEHACIGIHRNTNSHGAPSIQLSSSRGTSAGSNTIVQNNDYLGMINFKGADGSDLASGAYITAIVDGSPGSNDMPTRLGLWTSADGSQSPTERLRITSGGDLGLGVLGGMNQAGTLYIVGGQGVRWTHPTDGTLYGDHYVSGGGQHVFRSGSGLTERLRIDANGILKTPNLNGNNHREIHRHITGFSSGSSVVNYLIICQTNRANVRLAGRLHTARGSGTSACAAQLFDVTFQTNHDASHRSGAIMGLHSGSNGYGHAEAEFVSLTYNSTNYYAIRFSSGWTTDFDTCSFDGIREHTGTELFTHIDSTNETITNVSVLNAATNMGDVTIQQADLRMSDGDIILADGHGISFSATTNSSGTMVSEILDDYEEGDWTPAINPSSVSYSWRTGKYTKIGNVVHIWFDIKWTSASGIPSNGSFSGLPYTAIASTTEGGYGAPVFRDASGVNSNIRIYGNSSYISNPTTIIIQGYDSSGQTVNYSFLSSGRVTGWAQYFTS